MTEIFVEDFQHFFRLFRRQNAEFYQRLAKVFWGFNLCYGHQSREFQFFDDDFAQLFLY